MAKSAKATEQDDIIAAAPPVPTGPTVLVGEVDSYSECLLDDGSTEGHPLVSVGGLQHARVADSPEGRPIYSRRGAPVN